MTSSTLPASPFRMSLPGVQAPDPAKLKHVSVRAPVRRLPVAASAAPSGAAAAAARERRRFLERYGLNPDDFEEDAEEDPREERRDRRRRRQSGRGEQTAETAVTPAKAAEPRETHKMLQVLGGKVRRRKLLSPKDRNVRPMMEVVRGAAFDILQSAGGSPASLRPGRWLDLYSGTGSVGIEAMSRGCSEAHFVEMDPWVISEVLKPNLECTGFIDVSHIHMLRVEKFLANAEKSQGKYPSFDYISVTPPYLEVNYSTLLAQLARSPLVGKDCFILVEYPLKTDMAESCGNLIKIADRRFGRTNLLIYGPTWSEKKRRKGVMTEGFLYHNISRQEVCKSRLGKRSTSEKRGKKVLYLPSISIKVIFRAHLGREKRCVLYVANQIDTMSSIRREGLDALLSLICNSMFSGRSDVKSTQMYPVPCWFSF